jgi:hypothetical protein
MNRTVLFGGVAAVVVLLGTAGYLIFAGRGPAGTGVGTGTEVDGPVTANPVSVITEHTNNLSQDGKRLNLGFPGFELKAGAGQTTSSVFSTTWNIKVPDDERVVVATATINGFMKSVGTPQVSPHSRRPTRRRRAQPQRRHRPLRRPPPHRQQRPQRRQLMAPQQRPPKPPQSPQPHPLVRLPATALLA